MGISSRLITARAQFCIQVSYCEGFSPNPCRNASNILAYTKNKSVFDPHLLGQSGVKSLAIDWLTGQLYWASVTQKAIYTGAADGSAVGIVMSKEMDPSDMVLSPIERYQTVFHLITALRSTIISVFFLFVVSYFGLTKEGTKK